jgi:hypothetical protein
MVVHNLGIDGVFDGIPDCAQRVRLGSDGREIQVAAREVPSNFVEHPIRFEWTASSSRANAVVRGVLVEEFLIARYRNERILNSEPRDTNNRNDVLWHRVENDRDLPSTHSFESQQGNENGPGLLLGPPQIYEAWERLDTAEFRTEIEDRVGCGAGMWSISTRLDIDNPKFPCYLKTDANQGGPHMMGKAGDVKVGNVAATEGIGQRIAVAQGQRRFRVIDLDDNIGRALGQNLGAACGVAIHSVVPEGQPAPIFRP